jgi:hypothetical protein
MSEQVTILKITIHSEVSDPDEVVKVMDELGWAPLIDESDFTFEWEKNILDEENFKDYCDTIMNVHKKLNELDISYTLSTHEKEEKDAKKYY